MGDVGRFWATENAFNNSFLKMGYELALYSCVALLAKRQADDVRAQAQQCFELRNELRALVGLGVAAHAEF